MAYTLYVNNGPKITFEAKARYHRVFTYNLESSEDTYINVTFFLTKYNDLLMSVGKAHDNSEFFTDKGVYKVPHLRKIRAEEIERLTERRLAGLNLSLSDDAFIGKLRKFLDKIVEHECWVTPFTSPKGVKNPEKLIPLLKMIEELDLNPAAKNKVKSSIKTIESKMVENYGQGVSYDKL